MKALTVTTAVVVPGDAVGREAEGDVGGVDGDGADEVEDGVVVDELLAVVNGIRRVVHGEGEVGSLHRVRSRRGKATNLRP